ncbi:MAG TPA: SRPBCC family protein [Bacteroidia bacterium]|nr:SRPBCC family protein [Bacteroidia bacterium]
MTTYKFITYWNVNVPVEKVWEVIKDVRKWPEWWRGVLNVEELKKGSDNNHGARFAHTWQSFLPYKLKFETEITEVVLHRSITANVTGELEGTGRWEFRDEGNRHTTVVYHWHVLTTMTWMNITAPLLSGAFRWNHDTVMRWGVEGLARKLNCRVKFSSEWIH